MPVRNPRNSLKTQSLDRTGCQKGSSTSRERLSERLPTGEPALWDHANCTGADPHAHASVGMAPDPLDTAYKTPQAAGSATWGDTNRPVRAPLFTSALSQ